MSLVGVSPAAASNPIQLGNRAWTERAGEFVRTGHVPPEPVERALTAWLAALEENPEDFELRFKVMEALYFKGYFVVESESDRRRLFERLAIMAEEVVADVEAHLPPTSREEERRMLARAHFWAAIAWGLWGMSHSYVASGARGVPSKIRDHAEQVVALDEAYADGGGLRLLGRLHTVTPRIPLFTGWIDRLEGLRLLDRAYSISRRDPRNALFLAEAILSFRPEDRSRAVELLRDVSRRQPDSSRVVEETETIRAARSLLCTLEEDHDSDDC
jgi:hypothetical protein